VVGVGVAAKSSRTLRSSRHKRQLLRASRRSPALSEQYSAASKRPAVAISGHRSRIGHRARPGGASSRVHTPRKTPPQAVVGHHAMATTVRAARRLRPPSPSSNQAQRRDRYRRHRLVRTSFPRAGHTFARLRCATEVRVNAPTHNRVRVEPARPDAMTRAGIRKRLGRLPARGAVGKGSGSGNAVMTTFSRHAKTGTAITQRTPLRIDQVRFQQNLP
jgi:hypothetical protein